MPKRDGVTHSHFLTLTLHQGMIEMKVLVHGGAV